MYPKLYYTLDGTEPDFTSPLYTTPFVTSNTATVRAIAYNNLVTDKYEAATVAYLRSQLASFKQPKAFVRVDALPRTALGKVQKRLLPPWQA